MAATAQDVPLSVAEQLAAQQDKVDAFLALVGEDTLDKSMVGQGKLRDVWILRFLIGFKWKVAECAEKFKTMIAYRVQFGCDDVRKKMEWGRTEGQRVIVTSDGENMMGTKIHYEIAAGVDIAAFIGVVTVCVMNRGGKAD